MVHKSTFIGYTPVFQEDNAKYNCFERIFSYFHHNDNVPYIYYINLCAYCSMELFLGTFSQLQLHYQRIY